MASLVRRKPRVPSHPYRWRRSVIFLRYARRTMTDRPTADPDPGIAPDLARALAADRGAAARFVRRLSDEGRRAHPAVGVCDRLSAPVRSRADVLPIAAVALEAGVRHHLGRALGPRIRRGETASLPPRLVLLRPPPPWEPEEKRDWPHILVDWRAAMVEIGRAWADGDVAFDPAIPGAALLAALRAAAPGRGARTALLRDLLGPVPRDEALDPVATGGAFLAQGLADLIDLDLELRGLRERRIAAAAGIDATDGDDSSVPR